MFLAMRFRTVDIDYSAGLRLIAFVESVSAHSVRVSRKGAASKDLLTEVVRIVFLSMLLMRVRHFCSRGLPSQHE